MPKMMPGRVAAVLFATLLTVGSGKAASFGSPPSTRVITLAQQDVGDDGGGDAAAAVLRLNRLEEQVRNLTGQIEQLQFQNRKLDESLRKLQGDIDFRLQDLEHGSGAGGAPRAPATQRRGDAGADGAAPVVATTSSPAATTTPRSSESRRSDAFDPASDPAAPGAPRPLGTTTPSQPIAGRAARASADTGPRAPLDLTHSQTSVSPADSEVAPAVIAAPPEAGRDGAVSPSLGAGGARSDFDASLGFYKQGQFDSAASGFAAFADKNPKDRLVPDAVFYAGESYARLGRHREAAEQFLKLSTDYGKSPRAPDALLRLGISLNALGAHEQACATYQEVTRRYPSASNDVRSAVDRELKRARCTGNG